MAVAFIPRARSIVAGSRSANASAQARGTLTETFACGTAAVITPIGTVKGREESFTIGDAVAGPVARRLRGMLVDIQRGTTNDAHGWFQKVF